jgi:hypothetical protein
MLLVQHIAMMWTKASRGGEGARLRNSVPEVLQLPPEIRELERTVRLHAVNVAESSRFRPDSRCSDFGDPEHVNLKGFDLKTDGDGVEVFYKRLPNTALANRTRWRFDETGCTEWSRSALRLHQGQWGQAMYNGRFAGVDTGNWWYEKNVLNVAVVEEPDLEVFLRTRPAQRFVELASLR